MKRIFSVLILFLICICSTVYAAEPSNTFLEIKDGRHIITKIFEISPDDATKEYPSSLKEPNFELDGYSYAHFDTKAEEIPINETRQEIKIETINTNDNNAADILEQLSPEMDYDQDDFKGKLTIDHGSIQTEVEGYTTKTYTLTDSITLVGLGSNDPSVIPKTTVKSGVTLKLTNVDWVVHKSEAVDYNSIPTEYKAIATYSGSYTKQIPTGYITTVHYTGEVTKITIDKVVYTITYLGTKIPEPAPEPAPQPEIQKETSFIWWIAGLISLVTICSAVAFFLFYHNTLIYLKNAEEYQRIAKRRIKWSNPIVDLSGLAVSGKEVAIHVKKQMAKRLFGRQIKTIAAGDYSIRCLVDKQNCDFWYVLNIPENSLEEKTEESNPIAD